MSWAKTYKALYGRKLDDEDVKTWERLLDESFRRKGVDRSWEDHIEKALEEIRERVRASGRGAHPPDFGQVKSEIIRRLYEIRHGDDRPAVSDGEPSCPFCRDTGAFEYIVGLEPPYPSEAVIYMFPVEVDATFCVCPKGEQEGRKRIGDAYGSEALRRLREDCKAQFRAKWAAYEKCVADDKWRLHTKRIGLCA